MKTYHFYENDVFSYHQRLIYLTQNEQAPQKTLPRKSFCLSSCSFFVFFTLDSTFHLHGVSKLYSLFISNFFYSFDVYFSSIFSFFSVFSMFFRFFLCFLNFFKMFFPASFDGSFCFFRFFSSIFCFSSLCRVLYSFQALHSKFMLLLNFLWYLIFIFFCRHFHHTTSQAQPSQTLYTTLGEKTTQKGPTLAHHVLKTF